MLTEPPADMLARVPGMYTSELTDSEDTVIHIHFFLGHCDWYVAEYDGRDTFFGFVNLGDPDMAEWGYFSFAELKSLTVRSRVIDARSGALIGMLPAHVEMDQHWQPKPFCEVQAQVRA